VNTVLDHGISEDKHKKSCVFLNLTNTALECKKVIDYFFGKWCPGAQPYFYKISFRYRWLEGIKNMEVVLKVVHSTFVHQTVSNNREAARFHIELPSNAQYAPGVVVINLIKVTVSL